MSDRLITLWALLRPAPQAVDRREQLRAALGAAVGLGLTGLLCSMLAGAGPWGQGPGLWLVAPLGASAVLVFALPSSALAQPWAVVGGNTVSALVGIAAVHALDAPVPAAALGVGTAIGLMLLLRCLHPPGGAMALLMVLIGMRDPAFAWMPAALNSLLLVLAGVAWNHATGKRYPHPQGGAARPAAGAASSPDALDAAELEALLARHNEVLDAPRDLLLDLLRSARWQAHRRRLGALRCGDLMRRPPITVGLNTPLDAAWGLLRQHRIKALPVVDAGGTLVGIVTLADLVRDAEIRGTPLPRAGEPWRPVREVMSRQVRVASADRPLTELLPLFAQGGHHHLPIVGPGSRLLGILTQSDVVAALADAGPDGTPPRPGR
ncbi:HPP family protein [Aquariibacter albus]|uniref:HPP family protein n=1 Tax=Aquariibacter albus TaxID=2759899 RepID=A0A839HRP7_9BURK|nr:HPP family protein [Aquariibacter albus]MBB1162009.1 HPP family protein [Aquariibacter albus]